MLLKIAHLDQRFTFYNLNSNTYSYAPIDIFSKSAFIFSPNILFWKSARYQPFIGIESVYIKHSGDLGFDLIKVSIFSNDSLEPYSSNLLNLEIGLLVNQFKISYKWINYSFLGNNIVQNSNNPDSYSIIPIRHLEIVWQFWN